MELKTDVDERNRQVEGYLYSKNTELGVIIELFDAWSEHYEEDFKEIYKLDKHLDDFEDFVRPSKDARILDVTAGTGLCGQKLTERGYTNLDALDGSKGMLERARQKGIYKKLIHAVVDPCPIEGIEKDTYDVLFCAGSLASHHLRYESFESLITITKPGGYIFFLGASEWLFDERDDFEEEMRRLQNEGKWRWVLMKESPNTYYKEEHALMYCFKIEK